jgi:hypothetical protein
MRLPAATLVLPALLATLGALPATAVAATTAPDFSQAQAQRFARETGRPVHPGGGPPWLLIALSLALLVAAGFATAYLRARRQLRVEGQPV